MKITDQIGHQFELKEPPKRIISLVPSQTELLYDLGLEDKVVGITKFCIHPKEWFETKNRVGGTKTLNFKKIENLQPDLIIANKEENTQSEIEYLQERFPVYTSDISNMYESLEMITVLGDITGTKQEALSITNQIKVEFNKLSQKTKNKKNVLYLIWQNPIMSIGTSTFIHDMLKACDFQNVLSSSERYPELSEVEINSLNPDYIFLSSEPFPFNEKHKKEFKQLFPQAKIELVDGEYFSWYGSRLQNAPQYFIDLIDKIS